MYVSTPSPSAKPVVPSACTRHLFTLASFVWRAMHTITCDILCCLMFTKLGRDQISVRDIVW